MENELIDYLLGRLPEAERQAFERKLAADPPLERESDELRKTWHVVQDQEEEPDAAMDTAFYALLDREKQNQKLEEERGREVAFVPSKTKKMPWYGYAAVLAAIGVSFWLGRLTIRPKVEVRTIAVETPPTAGPRAEATQNGPAPLASGEEVASTPLQRETATPSGDVRQELANIRRELKVTQELVVLGLLRKESAAERLKGLQYASHLPQLKPELLETLAETLRHDENINVRLATIETLRKFGRNQGVREALLNRLQVASEMPEQLSVIESLVSLREKNAIPKLKSLVDDPSTDPLIRQKAQQSIELLTI